MRRLGQILTILGAIVGIGAALAMILPVELAGVSWLIAVGLLKLTLAASLGMIAGGAVLQRIARRTEERERLLPPAD